jgi:hypothetical protein
VVEERRRGGVRSSSGELRWTRSSELYPLSSASPRGTFSACAWGAGAPAGGAVLRCSVGGKRVGCANEGADGATHGLCDGGLVACGLRGWCGTKTDTAEEARLREQRWRGGAPLSRGREQGEKLRRGVWSVDWAGGGSARVEAGKGVRVWGGPA